MLTRSRSETIVTKKYGDFLMDLKLFEEICAAFDTCEGSIKSLMDNVNSFLGHAIDMGLCKIQIGYMTLILPAGGKDEYFEEVRDNNELLACCKESFRCFLNDGENDFGKKWREMEKKRRKKETGEKWCTWHELFNYHRSEEKKKKNYSTN